MDQTLEATRLYRGGRFKGLKIMCFQAGPDSGNLQNRPEMGAPGPPDIVGLSWEIVGFRDRGGGPVGHPQGIQVKTLILNIKCLPEGHHGTSHALGF